MEYTDEELRIIGSKLAEQAIPPPPIAACTKSNAVANALAPLMYGHYCPCCGQWCVARCPYPAYPPYPPQVWYGGTAR